MLFDIRDALRRVWRSPGYSATVIVTLALTVGATTAVFSIVNGVLLEPLAYPAPDRLVQLRENWRELPNAVGLEVNERHFEYWRAHARSFEAMAQYILLPRNITGAGDAMPATVVYASGSLFDVLGIPVVLGRGLTTADEPSGASDVVVVSNAFWRDRLGADPGAIGRAIAVDGRSMVVAGVLASGVQLPNGAALTDRFDAIAALRMDTERVGWAGDHNNQAVARLRVGVTRAQASAELDVLQRQVGVLATADAHETVTLSSAVTPLADAIVGHARRGLWLLLAAIVAVLLIACANLANLSLTRSVLRVREAAIRTALGASRARLVGSAATEDLVLAAAGGALATGVAWLALKLFVRTAPIDLPRATEVAIDGRVLLFAGATSAIAGLLVGAWPAWRAGGGPVEAVLRAGGTAVASNPAAARARGTLVAVQVALTITLLSVTTLLAVSLRSVLRIDRGFAGDRVMSLGITLPARYAGESATLGAFDRVLNAIRAQPGVVSATTTSMTPLSGEGQVMFAVPEGAHGARSSFPTANFRFVSTDFFRTLDVPVVAGRAFTDAERDPRRPAPVVVSRSAAARLWPGENPLGKRLSRGIDGEQPFEVVGVAADARTTSLERTPPLMVYVPVWWRSRRSASVLVRSAGEPSAVVAAVTHAIRTIDAEIAIGEPVGVRQLIDRATAPRQYQTRLFVAFGAVALFIALVGVYGVTAYGVFGRRREINIRSALGASRRQVLRMIVQQGIVPIALGATAGVAGALAASHIAGALLFGIGPSDPRVPGIVTLVVCVVAGGACVMAAARTLAIDPAEALRES